MDSPNNKLVMGNIHVGVIDRRQVKIQISSREKLRQTLWLSVNSRVRIKKFRFLKSKTAER